MISAMAEPLVIATQLQVRTPTSHVAANDNEESPECPDSAASLHMSRVTEAIFDSPLEHQTIQLPQHPIIGKPFSEQPVYYAVAVGRNPGTYVHQHNAQLQIQRFNGAIWAICDSQRQAEAFIRIFNPKNIPFMPDSHRGINTPPPRFNAFAPNAHLTWPGDRTQSNSEEEGTSRNVHAYSSRIVREPSSKGQRPEPPCKTSLKSIIAEAANYGCYIPVIMNGKASVWHYDSGAALTQAHPDTLREMIPGVEQRDTGGATFASAEAKSKVDLSLWFVKEIAILQMESGIRSITISGYIVGNPKVRKGTLLFGLNLQKPLHLSDTSHADVIVDAEGRPFRKFPESYRKTLQQQVNAWNRRQRHVNECTRPIHNKQETPPDQIRKVQVHQSKT